MGDVRGVVFQTGGEQPWRFRLVAANNEVVAQSEGYVKEQSAIDTVHLILGPDATIEIAQETPKLARKISVDGEVRAYHGA